MTMKKCSITSASTFFLLSIHLLQYHCFASSIPNSIYDNEHTSLLAQQFSEDNYESETNKLSLIFNDNFHLVDCITQPDSFVKGDSYQNINCKFCDIGLENWKKQRDEPSSFPTFRDLVSSSNHCIEHYYEADLGDTVDAVRRFDSKDSMNGLRKEKDNTRFMEIAALIFHQGRAGVSTLMNAITAAEGDKARVYADNQALSEIMNACDSPNDDESLCQSDLQKKALVDVLYLLTRTNGSETKAYFQMNASSTADMNLIKSAANDIKSNAGVTAQGSSHKFFLEKTHSPVKWAYIYREDSDVALTKQTEKKKNSCVKKRKLPTKALLSFLETVSAAEMMDSENYESYSLEKLNDVEVCSAYIASLQQAAFTEYAESKISEISSNSLLINYEVGIKNKDNLLQILSNFFQLDVLDENNKYNTQEDKMVIKKVKEQINKKSNGRGLGSPWETYALKESEELSRISDDVKAANNKFLNKVVVPSTSIDAW